MQQNRIVFFVFLLAPTFFFGQYSFKQSEVLTGNEATILGKDKELIIRENDNSWQSLAVITISEILSQQEADKFQLFYGLNNDPKELVGNYDPGKKEKVFSVASVAEIAPDGVFFLNYNNLKKGKIQFKISNSENKKSNSQPENSDPYLFRDASKYVEDNNRLPKSIYDARSNVYRRKNLVYIYIDADGQLIKTGYPTAATREFLYQIILLKRVTDKNSYRLVEPEAGISDAYNIYYPEKVKPIASASSATGQPSIANEKIEELHFEVMGPFEEDFKLSIIKNKADAKPDDPGQDLMNHTVKVAKFYYASIQAGLVASLLRNPQNVTKAALPAGDSTLTADDPQSRGIFTLMAVFYPWGRSMLFPPRGSLFSRERFGIIIGTRLDKEQFTNFFGGLQFDFARGGSISLGAHYGRRTVIQDHRDFHFGKDIFEGTLDNKIKQQWNISPFIGVNVDVRIFNFLFGTKTDQP